MAEQHLTIPEEIWKPIPGFPGYEVSDQGRIQSYWGLNRRPKVERGFLWTIKKCPQRIIKSRLNDGYQIVSLRQDGKHVTNRISRFVLMAFSGPCPPGMEGCHNDGNRLNDHPYNLRWDTPKGNTQDKFSHGTVIMGMNHKLSKLTDKDVLEIRKLYAAGISSKVLAFKYHLHRNSIVPIVARKSWKHIP